MPHFFIKSSNISGNTIRIDDKELFKHIVRVLRTKPGEKLLFIDENKIQYETTVSEINSSSFECNIENKYKSEKILPINLYVAQSVLNSDAQTSAIQKAAELGVKGIIPLYTDYCSVKESYIKSKIEKWQKIASESCKQCERADIPDVMPVSTIYESVKKFDRIIVFAERYAQSDFFKYIKNNPINKEDKILIIIGPEGGFSENEFDYFKKENIPLITLGNLIYRADTALTAALTSVINGVLYV